MIAKQNKALIKLATLRHAINYVLRSRMIKQADPVDYEALEDDLLEAREYIPGVRYVSPEKREELTELLDLLYELPETVLYPDLATEEGKAAREKRIQEHKLQMAEDAEMLPQLRFRQEFESQYPSQNAPTPAGVADQGANLSIPALGPPYRPNMATILEKHHEPDSRFSEINTRNVYTHKNPYLEKDNVKDPEEVPQPARTVPTLEDIPFYQFFNKYNPLTQRGFDNISTRLFGIPSVKTTSEDNEHDFGVSDMEDFEQYLLHPYKQMIGDDVAYNLAPEWAPIDNYFNSKLLPGKTVDDIDDWEIEHRHFTGRPNNQGVWRFLRNSDYETDDSPDADPHRKWTPIPRDVLQYANWRRFQEDQMKKRIDAVNNIGLDIQQKKRDFRFNEHTKDNPYYRYFGDIDRDSPTAVYQFNDPNKRKQLAYSYIEHSPLGKLYTKYPNFITQIPYQGYKTFFNIVEGLQTPKGIKPVKRFGYERTLDNNNNSNVTFHNTDQMPEPPEYYYSPQLK